MKRRQFLKSVCGTALGAASFPYIVPSSVLGANGAVPPSEKVVMGFIGVGSMGGGHLRTFLGYDDVQVEAVCDLREIFRQRALERVRQRYGGAGCNVYRDYRELLAREDIDAEPKSLLTATIGPDEIRLPRSNNHRRNFIECVKSRRQTICPVDSAVRSDTICHLDDIAIRLGRKLRWDPEKEQFINDDQANRMLSRPKRSPWHL